MKHFNGKQTELADEFIEILTLISGVVENYETMVSGDLNVDFIRTLNKPSHVFILIESLNRLGLLPIALTHMYTSQRLKSHING